MFSAHRNWTNETINVFNAKRDQKRAEAGLKPFHLLSSEEELQLKAPALGKTLREAEMSKLTVHVSKYE